MDFENCIYFHDNINDCSYLDLEMTQYQYNHFSGKLYLNSKFINQVLRLRIILNNYYKNINPILFKMNYYSRMVYFDFYMDCNKLIKIYMFYYFESYSNRTTETLDKIKYKSTFSRILFYYFKGYNNFIKFNCPSSLLNISTKKILNILIQNDNLNLEYIRKILPSKIFSMINYNYFFNFNSIEMYESGLMTNKLTKDICIRQDVIISDILLKHFSDNRDKI
jgi:hypothetical protein